MSKYAGVTGDILTQARVQTFVVDGDGEAIDNATKLAIASTSGAAAAAALELLVTETLTADRILTITVNNAARTIDLTGNLVLAGNLTTTGAFNITLAAGATVTLTLPGASGTLATLAGSEALTNKTITAPAITGGTAIELTTFSLRSSGAAFDLIIATSAIYTADRTLTINIPTTGNAALTLTGNLAMSGAFNLTLTVTADTNVTLPTTGTLATTGVTSLASLTTAAALVTVGTIGTGVWQGTTVGVAYGGTGLTTITNHGVLLGQATAAIVATSAGTAGQPLLSAGAAADPDWGTLGVAYGGTGATTLTDHGVLLGSGTGAVTILGVGTTGTLLRGATGADPAWTTLTMPATIGINEIFYASSANVLGVIAAANSSVLVSGGTGVPSMATDIPTAVTIGTAYIYRVGGTDVALADGGTNAALTASLGGIVYSTATALAVLAAGTAGQLVRSGGGAAPTWTTTTYPATNAINTIPFASGANVMGAIAAAASSVLVTSAGNVPSLATDIPTAVTIGAAYIYRVGGTDVAVADGGTALGTYTVGDILHATGAGTLAGLTAVAVGQVLCSGGAATVAAWSATPTFTSSVQTGRAEVGRLNFKDETALTMDANGEITVTQSCHDVDTNAAGATDDLEAIIGGAEGDILIIRPTDATHSVVAQHAGTPTTGVAMNLASGVNFTMDEDDDFLVLCLINSLWQEISRSENHA